jgi:acyl-CoA synthetase (AMP-forming)/AMP-acid ligase II
MYPGTHAAAHPDKPAIVMDQSGESVSYGQLEDRSVRLANALRDRGLLRGDVVALLAENHVRYFEVYWAAHRCGLYLTPVNRHLSPSSRTSCGAFARTRLAGYKIPRGIDFRDELPRLPTGKLAKHVLRDEYLTVPSP